MATPFRIVPKKISVPTTASDGESTGIALNERFYFPDSAGGLSIFKVDGTYYKVHRYLLERESPVFKAMFDSPLPPEGQDGESNERPINIPDISRSEFEALLDFLYNGGFSCMNLLLHLKDTDIPANKPAKQKKKLYNEAISSIRRKLSQADNDTLAIFDLLSISLRFEFERIINMVVSIIDLLDSYPSLQDNDTGDLQAVKRICMALRHDALRHWCLPAFQALVNRPASLTAEEGRRLGYHRMAIVAEEREKRLSSGEWYTSGSYVVTSIFPEFLLSD